MSNQQTTAAPDVDEQIAAGITGVIDTLLRRPLEDRLSDLQRRQGELQARFDRLFEAQDELREINATQAEQIEKARRENAELRATVERLTRQRAKPVRPPVPDDQHCGYTESQLLACPMCGHSATLINRRTDDYQVACASWRAGEVPAHLPCSITTGSYGTPQAAAMVWNRRSKETPCQHEWKSYQCSGGPSDPPDYTAACKHCGIEMPDEDCA